MPRFAVLDGPTPIAFAHRGAHEQVPENSLRAFEEAHRLGYRFFETDVHVSADGRLYAFHDDVLDRVTDRTGPLSALPAAELARVRIDGTDPIPTFDELLESFPDVRWNVDPKSDGAVMALTRALRRHDAVRRVNVGAFSDDRLGRLRSLLGPELSTAAGPREVAALTVSARIPAGRRRREHDHQRPRSEGGLDDLDGLAECKHRREGHGRRGEDEACHGAHGLRLYSGWGASQPWLASRARFRASRSRSRSRW